MDEIKKIISKLKLKTYINIFIRQTYWNLIIIGIVFTMIIMGSKFVPIIFLKGKLIKLGLFLSIVIYLVGFKNRNQWKKELVKLDNGSKIITAIEYENDNSDIAKLQREDTQRFVQEQDISKLYFIRIYHKNLIKYIGVIIMLLVVVNIIPTRVLEEKNYLENIEIKTQKTEKLLKKSETLINKASINNELKKELLKKLEESKDKIKKIENKDIFDKEIKQESKNIAKLAQKSNEELKKQLEKVFDNKDLIEKALNMNTAMDLEKFLKNQKIDENMIQELMELQEVQELLKQIVSNMDKSEFEKLKQMIASHNKNQDCGQEGGT